MPQSAVNRASGTADDKLFEPRPRVVERAVAAAERPATLAGTTIGVLDGWGNRTDDGEIEMYPLLADLVEGLRRLAGVDGSVLLTKTRVISPPTEEELGLFDGCAAVITGVGVSGASTAAAVTDAVLLEARGFPTLTVCQDAYRTFALELARDLGFPDLDLVTYPTPSHGNMTSEPLSAEVLAQAISDLTRVERTRVSSPRLADPVGGRGLSSADDWVRHAHEEGWTDGLPVAPPTGEAVARALEHVGADPDEVIGEIPPRRGVADMHQIAVNAVMAGCTPELLPVVVAAVRAVLDPRYDLYGAQVTTNGLTPLVVVSGPAVERLSFNARHAALSSLTRSNATVGRALQLILRNIGGAVPGTTSMVTHGHPGRLSYCVAENRAESPWPSLHTDNGFAEEQSCVTVFGCQAPFALYLPGSSERIMRVLATTLPTPGVNAYFAGGELLVVLAPTPARELAAAGLSRADLKRRIWEEARYELGALRRSGVFESERNTFYWGIRGTVPDVSGLPDETLLPMVDGPDDVHLLVTGPAGQWWGAFCAGWGEFGGSAVTVPLE